MTITQQGEADAVMLEESTLPAPNGASKYLEVQHATSLTSRPDPHKIIESHAQLPRQESMPTPQCPVALQ